MERQNRYSVKAAGHFNFFEQGALEEEESLDLSHHALIGDSYYF
jgi:hypothetical protein